MPTYVVIAKTPDNPMLLDHVTAADLATAQTMVTAALAKGVGVGKGGTKSVVQVALILADAAFQITPT